jgi:hypothetical protein
MTASLSCITQQFGTFECYIRIDHEDGRYFHIQRSVPEEQATEENIELWKQQGIEEASIYWESL